MDLLRRLTVGNIRYRAMIYLGNRMACRQLSIRDVTQSFLSLVKYFDSHMNC